VRTARDLAAVVVGVSAGRSVRLGEVARVRDAPDEDEREVWTYADASGPGRRHAGGLQAPRRQRHHGRPGGAGAGRAPEARAAARLEVAVTRDYGRTAKQKSDELLLHMLLATLSVTALIALALGLRRRWWCWWPSRSRWR